jgi:hypothetical protein
MSRLLPHLNLVCAASVHGRVSILICVYRYSILTRKVSPLAYNDYLHSCACSLATTKEAPSDPSLIYQLELTHEAERVYSLFNYSETDQPQSMSDGQLRIYVNAFASKLKELRARVPPSITKDRKYPCPFSLPFASLLTII